MKYFLYLCALLLAIGGILGGAGCRATRPPANPYPRADGTELPALGYVRPPEVPDTLAVRPKRRLLGLLPPARVDNSDKTASNVQAVSERGIIPSKKCKGCTFNYVLGNQQNNTAAKNAAAGSGATSAAKASAPVAGQGGVAQDYTKQGQRGGAAASGAGASATATTNKGFPWWLLGVVAALGGGFYLYRKFS